MANEILIMVRDYLAVPQGFSIVGMSLCDSALEIVSLKLVYVPLIIALVSLALWMIFIGIVTGKGRNRTIGTGNFWLLLTGVPLQIVVLALFGVLLWLINK
jgi:hypothetical protein